jgi:hypothetical protein
MSRSVFLATRKDAMSAQVANATLVGSAARVARAYGASTRPQVDGTWGANAAPGRDQASAYGDDGGRWEPGARARRAEFQDQVISFGGVLVSLDVGAAIVQAQASNGLYPTPPADAERQVANYEYAQSLVGPAEPLIAPLPVLN